MLGVPCWILDIDFLTAEPALGTASASISGWTGIALWRTVTGQSHNDNRTGDYGSSHQYCSHGIKLTNGDLPYFGQEKSSLISICELSCQAGIRNTGMKHGQCPAVVKGNDGFGFALGSGYLPTGQIMPAAASYKIKQKYGAQQPNDSCSKHTSLRKLGRHKQPADEQDIKYQ